MEANGGDTAAGEEKPRRVNVVYFLSHDGQTERAQFFRAHHAPGPGVCLRDVKRWLAELRGKDMPDAYAWSYKRKYRTGYIWQDLADDDLLTPIADTEYVILGSEKVSSLLHGNAFSSSSPMNKKQSTKAIEVEDEAAESPDLQSSILTDNESIKLDLQQKPSLDSSFRFGLLRKKKKKMDVERSRRSSSASTIVVPATSSNFTWPSAGNSQSPKRKSYSSGPSHVLRNLITCGAVDTRDAILVVLSRPGSRTDSPAVKNVDHRQESARKSSTWAKAWTDKDDRRRDNSTQKAVPAMYKPASRPTCSQCGNPFKPEKMHKHMQSCPGMKSVWTRKSSLPENECRQKPTDAAHFDRTLSSILAYTH